MSSIKNFNFVSSMPAFVINETVRIGHGQHLAAQFDNYFGAVLGDIAATGNYAVLVFNGVADMI